MFGASRVVFSRDGEYLAVQARNPPLSLFRLNRDLTPVELPGVRGATDFALGDRYAAARDSAGKLTVWDIAGGKKLPAPGGESLSKLVIDETGQFLASLSQDHYGKGAILIRTLPALKQIGRVAFDSRPEFALAPGGTRLAISGRSRATASSAWRFHVDIVDVASARRLLRIHEDRSLTMLRFSPDGQTLWTIGDPSNDQDKELRVWDAAHGRLLARLPHEQDIYKLRRSSQAGILATQSNGVIGIWNFVTGKLLGQYSDSEELTDFQLSRDGRHLLTGNRKGEISLALWRDEDLRLEACQRLTRNLSAEEWAHYLGAEPYRATCPPR